MVDLAGRVSLMAFTLAFMEITLALEWGVVCGMLIDLLDIACFCSQAIHIDLDSVTKQRLTMMQCPFIISFY